MIKKISNGKIQHMPQLHALEDELLQINGLLKVLQQILPDGSEHTCMANALA